MLIMALNIQASSSSSSNSASGASSSSNSSSFSNSSSSSSSSALHVPDSGASFMSSAAAASLKLKEDKSKTEYDFLNQECLRIETRRAQISSEIAKLNEQDRELVRFQQNILSKLSSNDYHKKKSNALLAAEQDKKQLTQQKADETWQQILKTSKHIRAQDEPIKVLVRSLSKGSEFITLYKSDSILTIFARVFERFGLQDVTFIMNGKDLFLKQSKKTVGDLGINSNTEIYVVSVENKGYSPEQREEIYNIQMGLKTQWTL